MSLKSLITGSIFFIGLVIGQELSLNDCVNIALENKETLGSARLDLQSAQAGKRGALSNILPSINFTGGRSETNYANNNLFTDNTSWSAGVSGTQTIYDGGGWWNRIAQANNNFLIAEQLERQIRTNVIVEVHRAYFQVLKLEQLVEVAKQNLELSEQQVELAQKRFDLGAAKKTDLLKSEVARGTAQAALIAQKSNLGIARNDLRNAMGLINEDVDLMLRENLTPIDPVQNLNDAIIILETYNPVILAAQMQLKDAELRLKLARALRLPSLNATMSYGANSAQLDGLTDALNDDWTLRTNLNLSFPLFNGFALSTQTQQAKLAILKQENDVATITNDVIAQVDNLIVTVNDFFKIIPINEEVLASAEEDLKLVSERYRLGSASILELLDAQVSVTRARVELVSSKYDAQIQEALLKAQLGILDKQYE